MATQRARQSLNAVSIWPKAVGGIKAANAAVNVIDLASRAGRLGVRVSRRR